MSKARGILLIMVLALLVALPYGIGTNYYYMELIVFLFIYCILAESWNIVGGYAGLPSLVHGTFYGLGMYIPALLFIHIGVCLWLGLFVAIIFTMALSYLIVRSTARFSPIFFAMVLIPIAESIRYLIKALPDITMGAAGFLIPGKTNSLAEFSFTSSTPYYYFFLGLLLAVVLVTVWISKSKTGFHLVAIREDTTLAESVGVNSYKCRQLALGLSCFFVTICGFGYAMTFRYIIPTPELIGVTIAIEALLITYIGGKGTVAGPIVGAIFYVFLREITRTFLGGLPGLHYLLIGICLIVTIKFLPNGIMSKIGVMRGKVKK